MAELMFYKQIVSLDQARHGHLRLAPVQDFSFAAQCNSLPLLAVEFVEAQREFPIVFVKGADDAYLPVALLGLREAENLFVSRTGAWSARYLPAFIRRYPFVPADVGDKRMVLCVDEAAACLQAVEGEALFAEDGSQSPLLQRVLAVVQDYQEQALRTQAFCQRLVDMNLLIESNAQAQLPDGESFRLAGLYVIDEKRLQVLDKAKVGELFNSGELALVYAHLMSLGNLPALLQRMSEPRQV